MSNTELKTTDYQRFVSGDERALNELYQEFSPLILGIGRRIVGDDAEDLLQTVFLSAWKNRKQFDPNKGSMRSWLCGITRYRGIDYLRKKGQNSSVLVSDTDLHVVDIRTEEVDDVLDSLVVHSALSEIPNKLRNIVELGFLQELSHREIADKTGLPLGTVKSSMRRGLALLQSELEVSNVRN